MKMIKIYAIQKYYGQSSDEINWFIWNRITVPRGKEYNIYLINKLIPLIFKLPKREREI
ncbi:MAG: hypothetical protein HFJ12_04725 [Bacilli bacterium]|nr:hypothetical protein [Bacilli bacterium]